MSESELEALRRTVAELLAKRDKYKARIKELETSTTELQTKLSASEKSVHDLTIGVPLRTMAELQSNVPALWEEQLLKRFAVKLVDDKPALHSLDGKQIMKDGKPLPWEAEPIGRFLTDEQYEDSKLFAAITVISRASGAGGSPQHRAAPQQQQKRPQVATQFGLR